MHEPSDMKISLDRENPEHAALYNRLRDTLGEVFANNLSSDLEWGMKILDGESQTISNL